MHRRELTALSTARTRVHISLLLVARREFCAPSIASRSSTCVRAPRERDGHASRQDVQDCQGPMGADFVPGTPVNGTLHASWSFCSSHRRPADGRTAWHAARRAARSGSSMVHALSSQVLSPATSSWASPVHCACLRRPPSSDGRSDLCGNQNFTARSC